MSFSVRREGVTRVRDLLLLLALAGVAVLAGCGGANGPDDPATLNTTFDSSTVALHVPSADDGLLPRWMDVADTAYTTDEAGALFETVFDYQNANVTVTIESPASQLVITLSGTGLKPNFAYQIKLEGLPSVDPAANQILGELGRWWNDVGYLISGYFVTDSAGSILYTASSEVWPDTATPIDCSYHVLWKTTQRRPLRSDGPVIHHKVIETPWGYDGSTSGDNVGVYAEWESGRPKPGELILPQGDYQCLLRLTEEAFHMRDADGDMIYGWKTILDAPIEFTIGGGSEPPPEPSPTGAIAGKVTYQSGSAAKRVPVALTDETTWAVVASATTAGNGSYSFSEVPTDTTYVVAATDGSLEDSASGVSVAAGETTIVNLTLH